MPMMMNAMMSPGAEVAPFNFAGLYAHWFFSIVTLVGLVLLVVWMIRTLKPEKLILWAAVLTIIGILGVVFTVQYEMGFMKNMMQMHSGQWFTQTTPVPFKSPVYADPQMNEMMKRQMLNQQMMNQGITQQQQP